MVKAISYGPSSFYEKLAKSAYFLNPSPFHVRRWKSLQKLCIPTLEMQMMPPCCEIEKKIVLVERILLTNK